MDDGQQLTVSAADDGLRIDRFLALRAGRGGRAQVSQWLRDGRVTLDGRRVPKSARVTAGQRVHITPMSRDGQVASQLPPLVVVHEDVALIVVDKPAGLPSHGRDVDDPFALTAQLVTRHPELRGVGYRDSEPGIVHRLDTGTSGLLIVARTQSSFQALRQQLTDHAIDKQYIALCAGVVVAPRLFDGFLVSDRSARVKVSPTQVQRSRPARTQVIDAVEVNVVGAGACSLLTIAAAHAGRHQIRAHLAHAGHPLLGDGLYGGPAIEGLDRHFLHASRLALTHPQTGARMTFTSPLPPELQAVPDRA